LWWVIVMTGWYVMLRGMIHGDAAGSSPMLRVHPPGRGTAFVLPLLEIAKHRTLTFR